MLFSEFSAVRPRLQSLWAFVQDGPPSDCTTGSAVAYPIGRDRQEGQEGLAYAAVAASARQVGSPQPNAVFRQILTEETTYDAMHLVRGSLSDCRWHEVVGAEAGHQGSAGGDHESGRGLQSIGGRSESGTVPVAHRRRGDVRWRDTQRARGQGRDLESVVRLLRSEGPDADVASVEGGSPRGRRCRLHDWLLGAPRAQRHGEQG